MLHAGSGRTLILVVESHSGLASGRAHDLDGMRDAVTVRVRSGRGPLVPC